MADIWSKRKRSEVMSLIRSRGNKATELRLIEVFRKHRITGWRRRQRLTGNPDFVFRTARLCVFVDGCFWHGCPKHGTLPRQNRKYWDAKIKKNKLRDREVNLRLKRDGWQVIRIWGHELHVRKEQRLVARINKHLEAAVTRSSTRILKKSPKARNSRTR